MVSTVFFLRDQILSNKQTGSSGGILHVADEKGNPGSFYHDSTLYIPNVPMFSELQIEFTINSSAKGTFVNLLSVVNPKTQK